MVTGMFFNMSFQPCCAKESRKVAELELAAVPLAPGLGDSRMVHARMHSEISSPKRSSALLCLGSLSSEVAGMVYSEHYSQTPRFLPSQTLTASSSIPHYLTLPPQGKLPCVFPDELHMVWSSGPGPLHCQPKSSLNTSVKLDIHSLAWREELSVLWTRH